MNKPQGYLHSASGALFCLLIPGLPHYRSLFFAILGRLLLYCFLAFLLLFLTKRSQDIAQAIRCNVLASCSGVVLPQSRLYSACFTLPLCVLQDPFPVPLSKHLPPSLLWSCLESRPLHTGFNPGILDTPDIRSGRRRLFHE